MFALAALLCFLLQLFGAHIGGVDLVVLGLAFLACAALVGNWPVGVVADRMGSRR